MNQLFQRFGINPKEYKNQHQKGRLSQLKPAVLKYSNHKFFQLIENFRTVFLSHFNVVVKYYSTLIFLFYQV